MNRPPTLDDLTTHLVLIQGQVTRAHCKYHQAMRAWADDPSKNNEADMRGWRSALSNHEAELEAARAKVAEWHKNAAAPPPVAK